MEAPLLWSLSLEQREDSGLTVLVIQRSLVILVRSVTSQKLLSR